MKRWRTSLLVFAFIGTTTLLSRSAFSSFSNGAPAPANASPTTLFNLGNASMREGKLGHAIADYERAHLLEPRASDIATNLAAAERAAGLPSVRAWYGRLASDVLTMRAWTAFATIAFWIFIASAAVFAFDRLRNTPWRRLARVTLLPALGVVLFATAALVVADAAASGAIVVAPKMVDVRLSPFTEARVEGHIAEGQRVTVVGRHGAFSRVQDANGMTGWVENGAIESIIFGA